MNFNLNAFIPVLTLLVYLLLNWRFIRSKFVIIVPIIAGAVLCFFGLLTLTEDDLWLVILGCCIFGFGVVVDSCVRFKEALHSTNND
ncbi:MAG: hypothetical protein U9N81_05215 [Bacillota bacterium]|nr:hypothetical protein [Bacillota bacterium]